MNNLVMVIDYPYSLPTKERYNPKRKAMDMTYRNDWLRNRILKFYTEAEVEQVLTNRRSDYSDNALIADFFRADQPYHPIPIDDHVEKAVEWVTEKFRPNRVLHPVSFPDLRYYPFTLNVSAEAPWTSNNFTFRPTDRNVDAESQLPRLADIEREIMGVGNETPLTYLRKRQRAGFSKDAKLTYHNLYSQIFVYNRQRVHEIGIGAKQFWKGITPLPYYWNTIHARSHVVASDEPDKIRSVFGATKLLTQIELMFIWPLQASYMNNKDVGRMLWGREIIRGGWRKLFNEIHQTGPHNTFLSTDWSQFDGRLLHQLIRMVHRIWRRYFDFSKYEPTSYYPHSTPKNKRKLERLWKWMTEAILNTPILLPNGQLYYWKFNGFGSGFQQTQLLDSFCNAIMLLTCLSALGVNIDSPLFWARFQGDDSLTAFLERMFTIYGKHFLDQLAEAGEHYYNAKLSVKKTQISDRLTNVSVLSYFNQLGMPYRTDEDLLRHLYFPERDQDFERLAASAVGLAYANCGVSTRFHRLCEYIFNKLVHEKGFKPNYKAILWMVRSHVFPSIDDLKEAPFPTIEHLQAMVFTHTSRTQRENNRQWPNPNGKANGFWFLLNV
ncbi:RNA-dependent RNA polymerase [Hygrophorus penarioides partitivirus 1]|nr:RNA-dependent RNA polymerase [Hygrophorus penarioides partitivirus 1]